MAQLGEHLRAWLATNDPAAEPALTSTAGRFFAYGHGGLIRRPLSGGWEGQGTPAYRTASVVLGDAAERARLLGDPAATIDAAVRRHLAAHGPASRHDIAWWSGMGLRAVDAALGRLAAQLTADAGPDGRVYHDLAGVAAAAPPVQPAARVGVRLLPEFDALLCGYDPVARMRFVDEAHHARLWTGTNGLMLAPLLVDGRITGYWRLEGTGTRRALAVTWFARTRRPRRGEFEEPMAHVAAAYGVVLTGLTVTRE